MVLVRSTLIVPNKEGVPRGTPLHHITGSRFIFLQAEVVEVAGQLVLGVLELRPSAAVTRRPEATARVVEALFPAALLTGVAALVAEAGLACCSLI